MLLYNSKCFYIILQMVTFLKNNDVTDYSTFIDHWGKIGAATNFEKTYSTPIKVQSLNNTL